MTASDWHSGTAVLGVLRSVSMDGRDLLWLLNPTEMAVQFCLPRRCREALWRVLLDSAQRLPGEGPDEVPEPRESLQLLPHQSLLFERMIFP
jgi:hypothetical protein